MKTLIVVSGGDAPGINALLYHFCERASADGNRVSGAIGGFRGVLDGAIRPLASADAVPYMGMGGSILPSSRDPVLHDDAGRAALLASLRAEQIDNLMLFGGDGSLRYLPPILTALDIPMIGIPTTIDNDIGGTELTLGFDSACQYAYHTIDAARATGHALEGRLFSVETLGGHTGMLALAIAAGAGADAVITPEYAADLDAARVGARLKAAIARKGHALIVYTEFVPDKDALLNTLSDHARARLRDIRLGHAQRAGGAAHPDRLLARTWAGMAYDALAGGVQAGVTVWRGGVALLHHGALVADKPVPDRALYDAINNA